MVRTIGAAALVALSALPSWGGEFANTMARHFEPSLMEEMEASFTPGVVVAVVHDGREVYAKAFGVRSIDTNTPLTTDTLFHWASVTKPFVATSIMQLVESGRVELDERVTAYVPYFAMNDSRAEAITVRQLLNHTSGMPDVLNYNWHEPKYDDGALEAYVRGLTALELLYAPGEGQQYSNIAYEVLGCVIAEVSGGSFEEYVASRIFEPVGMESATLLLTEAPPEKRTTPHTATRRGPIVRKYWPYNREHAPSSTLIASVHDLARWALINLNRGKLDGARILSAEAYDTLWTPTAPSTSIGLSWFVREEEGMTLIEHGGSDNGFRTCILLAPAQHMGVVIAANSDKADAGGWARSALRAATMATPR